MSLYFCNTAYILLTCVTMQYCVSKTLFTLKSLFFFYYYSFSVTMYRKKKKKKKNSEQMIYGEWFHRRLHL